MRLHVPIQLRWSDLDAYGHVNNASMLKILEEARVFAFWVDGDLTSPDQAAWSTAVIDAGPEADTKSVISRQEIEYVRSMPYIRQPIDVELWIGHLGGASLDVYYEVKTPQGVEPRLTFVKASTTLVLVDAATDRPRRIDAREREAWEPYLEDPLTFRRRA
ncbi:acyl-CoA thioesterase [Herbiconiux sp. A18JL235]|uniref:Acyl-CoA thioesterase n=1 Tax=Herbiconiux sp. A18JL235 TaxID=3152363 RepID=A0AB39BDL8_9MICO